MDARRQRRLADDRPGTGPLHGLLGTGRSRIARFPLYDSGWSVGRHRRPATLYADGDPLDDVHGRGHRGDNRYRSHHSMVTDRIHVRAGCRHGNDVAGIYVAHSGSRPSTTINRRCDIERDCDECHSSDRTGNRGRAYRSDRPRTGVSTQRRQLHRHLFRHPSVSQHAAPQHATVRAFLRCIEGRAPIRSPVPIFTDRYHSRRRVLHDDERTVRFSAADRSRRGRRRTSSVRPVISQHGCRCCDDRVGVNSASLTHLER